ncbi:MAG: penicillin-binding protein 1C [Alphaproteobacteria bacterium]|nr:penicillin-binding protein 1C [Alphaproteobacteria bacterium]
MFLTLLYVVIPKPRLLEKYSYSSAVYDKHNQLLKIGLSLDDKYRLFVPISEIPDVLKQALISYEDNWFPFHFGVNPLSLGRVAVDMVRGGRVQGASTITMQLARIVYHIDSRKLSGKFLQILRAIQIELFYSKEEILEAYFNLAPYGGNIEGAGAASIIYFQARVQDLNLQQSMALAVIPQNPSKRNLAKQKGVAEVETAIARLQEIWFKKFGDAERDNLSLPLYAHKMLPFKAPHFVRHLQNQYYGEIFSTLDSSLQSSLEEVLQTYVEQNKSKGIYNATAVLLNHKTHEVVAYVGSNNFWNSKIQGQVDGIRAYRSPGSTLKPFIYTLALDEGIIHPMSMLKDVPKNYSFYTPENFDRSYLGLVNATSALNLSRNLPAIELMGNLKKDSFYNFIKKNGVDHLKAPEHYGLGLSLGAFELSSLEIAKMYMTLANLGEHCDVKLIKDDEPCDPEQFYSPEAAFLTLDMLSKAPEPDRRLLPFAQKRNKDYPVYWKTGTSYGYKDAWTAGIVGDYALVVWVGNFDGTQNNHFVGRTAASPLFFRIVRTLAKQEKMEAIKNYGLNLTKIDICQNTGDIDNGNCRQTVKSYFIPGVSTIKMSNITRQIPIDIATGKRACRHRPPQTRMESFDFWPSDILKIYEQAGINLKRPPEFLENCDEIEVRNQGRPPLIQFPSNGSTYIVRSHQLDEERIILKAGLDSDATNVYWYVNSKLIGVTKAEETLDMKAQVGKLEIIATDNFGRSSKIEINVKLID